MQTWSGERGIEEKHDEVFDGAVLGIGFEALLELKRLAKSKMKKARFKRNHSANLMDDGVVGVNFHSLLGDHVRGHAGVTEGLGLHETLHVSGPAWCVRKAWQAAILPKIMKCTHRVGRWQEHRGRWRDGLRQWPSQPCRRGSPWWRCKDPKMSHQFVDKKKSGHTYLIRGLVVLMLLLLLIGGGHLETLLGDVDELLAVNLLELLDTVLINGVDKVKDFVVLLLERPRKSVMP